MVSRFGTCWNLENKKAEYEYSVTSETPNDFYTPFFQIILKSIHHFQMETNAISTHSMWLF